MKIQSKPDYLIFAESAKKGENSDFPDVSRGWGITIDQTASKPPMEWMNGAFNRIDKNMLYLLQQGIPEWSELVKYPANAIIKYKGVLYTAIAENDNATPSTNTTKWKKTQAEITGASTSQSGVVKLNSSINSTSETEAATPLAVKKIYNNIERYQRNTYPEWIAPDNNGNTYPYARGVIVWHKKVLYVSMTDNNTSIPGINEAQWQPAVYQKATEADVLSGVDHTTIVTPKTLQLKVSTITPSAIGALTKVDADSRYLKQEKAPSMTILYPGGTATNPAIIQSAQRIVVSNPYPGYPVMVQAQVYINDMWAWSGHWNQHYSTGKMSGIFVHASQIADRNWGDIVIQSGDNGVAGDPVRSGTPHSIINTYTSVPYRLLIWRLTTL